MVKVPVKYYSFGESSGSEYSPENSIDLSDLVNSFIERGEGIDHQTDDLQDHDHHRDDDEISKEEDDVESDQTQTRETLQNLFGCQEIDVDDGGARQKIYVEVEFGCRIIGNVNESSGFKRRLMTYLREQGLDAGLCKSKWKKSRRLQAGDYEYIDVRIDENWYIVEPFLAREFEIARPTKQYTSLLDILPQIFVGKVEELKQIVRIMCKAIKQSMRTNELSVPPWRRNWYMEAKWLGSYKRTMNEVTTKKGLNLSDEGFKGKIFEGFENLSTRFGDCTTDFASHVGSRIGHLTNVFNGNGMGMRS